MKWVLLVGMCLVFALLAGAAAAQDGRDYFIETAVDNPSPFVGQRITYTLRFFAAADVTLPAQTRYQPSPFEGFWFGGELGESQTVQQVGERQYIVREIRTVLYPLRGGAITIEAAGVVFPATVFRGEETLDADPVIVNVQPLPEGAPEGYNGAVGQFDMVATLDRTEAALGEPLTLTLVITGSGNVEQLLPPVLDVPEDWRLYAEPPVYRSLDDTATLAEKSFSWQLVPGQAGEQVLPVVTLYFFDPNSRAYRSVSTAPVTLNIIPTNPGADSLPPGEPSITSSDLRPIKAVPATLDRQPDSPVAGFWLIALIVVPFLGVVGAAGWDRRRRWLAQNRLRLQQSRALAKAERGLQSAAHLPPEQAYRSISAAVLVYFHDKMDTNLQAKDQHELGAMMRASGVSAAAAGQVIACLEQADEGRFAPAQSGMVQVLAKQTAQALAVVEREWQGL